MDILNELIGVERYEYKCFDELKRLYFKDENFKRILEEGYELGKIRGFDDSIWEKINKQNVRGVDNFENVFTNGDNLGYCTVASKQLSYSFNNCFLCGGILPILKGSVNCEDGSHTWIVFNGCIIDTTLMLIINEDFWDKLGYVEENRYDPNADLIYRAAKDFTNDDSLSRGSK